MLPALFISHGAPDMSLRATPTARWLGEIAREMARPELIVIVSAHWVADPVAVTTASPLETIHDFGGFDARLYEQSYPAGSDAQASLMLAGLLEGGGIRTRLEASRGLDHGAWIPLSLMYPAADIPVLQVSLPASGLAEVFRMGELLAPLREQGALLIGSGGSTHNLRAIDRSGRTATWASDFESLLQQVVEEGQLDAALEPARALHGFVQAHPSIEHYAPLLFAWGAGAPSNGGKRVHNEFDYGNIGMSCFAFGQTH